MHVRALSSESTIVCNKVNKVDVSQPMTVCLVQGSVSARAHGLQQSSIGTHGSRMGNCLDCLPPSLALRSGARLPGLSRHRGIALLSMYMRLC